MRADEIRARGKRPATAARGTNQPTFDFDGRVKMTSRKNAQVESKVKMDGKVRTVLQHGKYNSEIFILDFCYPFSPV